MPSGDPGPPEPDENLASTKVCGLGLAFTLHSGPTHGQPLDRYGGFLDAKGERECQRYLRKEVTERVAPNQDNPWILGYYSDYGAFMREDLWINQTLSYVSPSPGRKRLLDVLDQRYRGDVAKLNTDYRTSFASFSDPGKQGSLAYPRWISAVKAGGPLPAQAGSREFLTDAEALLGEIVEQLHKVAHSEIRKHDSNHKVLGSHVKHKTYTKGSWERIAPYIDALDPQDLCDVNPIKPSVKATGVPAILSDQEFGNVFPLVLQGESPAPCAVPDHVDRRMLYVLLAGRIAPDLDFIGVSFCAVLYDQSHWRRVYDRGPARLFRYRRQAEPEPSRNGAQRESTDP